MSTKLKAKQTNIRNQQVVYVINNTPRRRTYTRKKPSTNPSEQGGDTQNNNPNGPQPSPGSGGGSFQLPDNRFLNSSNLANEIQRERLRQIENYDNSPQLRMNVPNQPLIDNGNEQQFQNIYNALGQVRYGMNYLLTRGNNENGVQIEDVSTDNNNSYFTTDVNDFEHDNFGAFGATLGSDSFIDEGDHQPDYEEPQRSPLLNISPIRSPELIIPPQRNIIFSPQHEDESPQLTPIVTRKKTRIIQTNKAPFMSPKGMKPAIQEIQSNESEPEPQEEPAKPATPATATPVKKKPKEVNFDNINIVEPKYGTNDIKKISYIKQYKALGGTDKTILNSPLRNLTVTQIRNAVRSQDNLNNIKVLYRSNGGTDEAILNSKSTREVRKAANALIKRNNAQTKVK